MLTRRAQLPPFSSRCRQPIIPSPPARLSPTTLAPAAPPSLPPERLLIPSRSPTAQPALGEGIRLAWHVRSRYNYVVSRLNRSIFTPRSRRSPGIMSRWNLAWLLGIAAVALLGIAVSQSATLREKDRDYDLVRLMVDVMDE